MRGMKPSTKKVTEKIESTKCL